MKKLWCAIAISLIAVSSASAATAHLPGLTQEGTAKPKVRPTLIVYTGDGSGYFAGPRKLGHSNYGHLSWSNWTKTRASGSGANWVNNCKPSCAQGTYTGYPVKLQASTPKRVEGYLLFTRLKVTYTGKRPAFAHDRTQTWKLGNTKKFFYWKFPS